MNKKLKLTVLVMLTLICLISGGVFAAPQSSPSVNPTKNYLKGWVMYGEKGYILDMRGTSSAMGNANVDVHLQRNTEYGAMLILGISDYGKQASGVSYNNLFTETANGLPTTTGNVSGIYQVGSQYEFVAAGKPDSTYSYYLNRISSVNRDEYSTSANSTKRGDAMNLFGSSGTWIKAYNVNQAHESYNYIFFRKEFQYGADRTYDVDDKNNSTYDYGRRGSAYCARAVVTQYN